MLKIFIRIQIFAVFLPLTGLAFFSDNIILHEEHIQAYVKEDTIEMQKVWHIENKSHTSQTFSFLHPFRTTDKNIQLSYQKTPQEFKIHTNQEKTEKLFELAKSSNRTSWLRWGHSFWERLLVNEKVLNPQEKIVVKLKWNTSPDFINDVYFTELLLTDIEPKKFVLGVRLESKNPIKHFFHLLPVFDWKEKKEKYTRLLFFEGKRSEIIPNNTPSLSFFWSHLQTPSLIQNRDKTTYFAHFPSISVKNNVSHINIVLDISGSMFGEKWSRTQRVLRSVLEKIPPHITVKTFFLSDVLEPWNTDITKNSRKFHRELFTFLPKKQPLGTIDWDIAFAEDSPLKTDTTQQASNVTFLFTDHMDTELGKIQGLSPLIIFDLSHGENTNLNLIAKKTGGFTLPLFPSSEKFVEENEWLQKWSAWKEKIGTCYYSKEKEKLNPLLTCGTEKIPLHQGEQEVKPSTIPGRLWGKSHFFLGRKFWHNDPMPSLSATLQASFIPRIWGYHRLSEILSSLNPTDTEIEAILSIGKYFGISLDGWFNANTTISELQKKFAEITDKTPEEKQSIKDRINFTLEKEQYLLPPSSIRWVGVRPFYPQKNGSFQSITFPQKVDTNRLLKLAPWSESIKMLFMGIPDIIAPFLAINERLDFCTTHRCISIQPNGRKSAKISDKMYFQGHHTTHWGNGHFERLVDERILTLPRDGNLNPDTPITRGDFATMMRRAFFPNESVSPDTYFSDVPEDAYFYEPINILRKKNIVRGYEDGTFRPTQALSRSEGIKILLATRSFFPKNYPETSQYFNDLEKWMIPWVDKAFSDGIIQGYPEKKFLPNLPLTRAQSAKIIVKALDS